MAGARNRGGAPYHTVNSAGPFLQDLQKSIGGSIPFDRFMQEALYNPDFGYYSARVRTVGRRADFSTFATLDRSLAKAIASWIKKHNVRHVIEIGAGSGQLARDILSALGWWRRQSLHYHIVDVSVPLRQTQKALLSGFRVEWHSSLRDALQKTGGRAHIFSNELVDAFPCRVFERTQTGWQELHLLLERGQVREILKPCEIPQSTVFQHPFSIGQRVEVHESYRDWLHDWAAEWKSGNMLTIDYGETIPLLYYRKPAGTLRGYAAHQVLKSSDIYRCPGLCDITADVNFSDLEDWGAKMNLRKISRSNLAAFLAPNLQASFQFAAEAFYVLEQATEAKTE